MMEDVFTRLMHLPPCIHGFSRRNKDDSYTIVLNDGIAREAQEKAYWHEIEHIEKGDFQEAAVDEVECIRHGRG